MSDFWGELGKTQQALDEARKEAERLAREAGKVAQDVATEAGRGVSGALGQVQQLVTGEAPAELVNIAALHERRRALQQIIARRRAMAEATTSPSG